MSSDNHEAGQSAAPGRGHHEEEHEEHVNHEAWVIPYADMLTLLMALFLMLWATSTVNEEKFAALAESLRDAFGNGTGEMQQAVMEGSPGVFDGQESGVEGGDRDKVPDSENPAIMAQVTRPTAVDELTASQAIEREQLRQELQMRETATLNSVQKQISAHAASEGVLESVKFRQTERGLVVTIVTDQVVFESGSSVLQPRGERIVRVIAEALNKAPNKVMVEGHTDNQPIATAQFPSNWELSGGRGASVLRYMVDNVGFDRQRIAAAGYGDTQPLASNADPAGRSTNRRVEVVVLRNVA
jgi:chemotaxis protein MotB